MSEKELVITEDNFAEHFTPVRLRHPQKDEVMACFTAMAELTAGPEKEGLISILHENASALAASQVMKRRFNAADPDCWRVPKEIIQDLLGGMSKKDVNKKIYNYKIELFYYTKPENIPQNDPHWTCISLLNLDKIVSTEDDVEITSKLEI